MKFSNQNDNGIFHFCMVEDGVVIALIQANSDKTLSEEFLPCTARVNMTEPVAICDNMVITTKELTQEIFDKSRDYGLQVFDAALDASKISRIFDNLRPGWFDNKLLQTATSWGSALDIFHKQLSLHK